MAGSWIARWLLKVNGIVLEGEFPEGTAARIAAKNEAISIIELTSRSRLALGSAAPVLGTYQGVWPGISVDEEGGQEIGSHLVRLDRYQHRFPASRPRVGHRDRLDRQPPARENRGRHRALPAGHRRRRHFRRSLGGRVRRRSGRATRPARRSRAWATWKRMAGLLAYFEQHPEWRAMRESGQLAVVQDPGKGGLLSGGILDMIAVKHTPVRPDPAPAAFRRIPGRRHHGGQRGRRGAHSPNRRKSSALSRAPAAPC